MFVPDGLHPDDLSQVGWGVIFSSRADPKLREALSFLLDYRRLVAGEHDSNLYREFTGPSGYHHGESKREFLLRNGGGEGDVDPYQIPYYLLLVGGPEDIPFEFQYRLGGRRRVGRLHFDAYEEYENYARNVVEAETQLRRSPAIAFLGDKNAISPDLATAFPANSNFYENLQSLLRAQSTPTVLLHLSQGSRSSKYSPADVPDSADLRGLTIFCGGTFGAGVSREKNRRDVPDSADLRGLTIFCGGIFGARISREENRRVLSRGFVAPLPKKLLGKREGAIAFLGHVTKVPTNKSQRLFGVVLKSALNNLMRGRPVGSALDSFSLRYVELATDIHYLRERAEILPDRSLGEEISSLQELAESMRYVLIGDPAARPRLNRIGSFEA